nr:MAG TPA: hypothetical protein [Caudoviricetes sp.]
MRLFFARAAGGRYNVGRLQSARCGLYLFGRLPVAAVLEMVNRFW